MPTRAPPPAGSVRRRIEFDAETWHVLHKLSLDSMKSLQDLADEAFRDLLKKHRRPTTLKEMLRESARSQAANDRHPRHKSGSRGDLTCSSWELVSAAWVECSEAFQPAREESMSGNDGRQPIDYKTHILIGVRPNGVMTVIADWANVPRQAEVQEQIDVTRENYSTFVLATPTSIMHGNCRNSAEANRKSSRPLGRV